jgi:hypothetical protein
MMLLLIKMLNKPVVWLDGLPRSCWRLICLLAAAGIGSDGRNGQGHFSFELGERLQWARRGEGIGQKGGDIAAGIPGQRILYV